MQLGRNITYEYLVSQSLFYQVLNAVSQYISKKMFNGEMIFKKYTEKIELLQLKVLINIIVGFRAERFFARF